RRWRSPRSPLCPYTTLFRSTATLKVAKRRFPLFDAGFHICEHLRGFGRSSRCSQNSSLGNLQTNVGRMASWRVRWFQSLIGNLRSEEHTSELQSRENLVCRL